MPQTDSNSSNMKLKEPAGTKYQSITVEDYHQDDEASAGAVTDANAEHSTSSTRRNVLFTVFVCLACSVAFLSSSDRSPMIKNENAFPPMGIINGNDVDVGEYPWYASIMRGNNGKTFYGCGGMLVAPEYILTAAHCADESITAFAIGNLCMRVLKNKETAINDGDNCNQFSEKIFRSGELILDPLYDHGTTNYDFMLVKLERRATTTPVSMNQDNGPIDDFTTLDAIGFGDIDITEGFETPDRLQDVRVSYIKNKKCNRKYNAEGAQITDAMLCAASPGKDACQNDSGGPLYDKERNMVVGVTSWGFGCADADFPGVYARISSRWDWIMSTICNDHSDPKPDFCEAVANPPSSPSCTDMPGWVDSDNDGCEWYESRPKRRCSDDIVNKFKTDSGSAQDNCCVCGGGKSACKDVPGWVDSYGDGCLWYEVNGCSDAEQYKSTSGSAEDTCCTCGGGSK